MNTLWRIRGFVQNFPGNKLGELVNSLLRFGSVHFHSEGINSPAKEEVPQCIFYFKWVNFRLLLRKFEV
jgi:hypothetical protein